jgi:FHS family L-fucose permease-like MFS transporter
MGGLFILSGIELSTEESTAMSPDQLSQYLQMEANAVKIPYLIIAVVVLVVAALVLLVKMPEASMESKIRESSVKKVLLRAHLKWGVVAQFFYVGAQVCVTSFFIRFARFTNDTPEKDAAFLLTLAMLGFMIGRFAGTWLTRFIAPNKLLAISSLVCIGLLTLAIGVDSGLAVWAVFAIPFFESIMFPTIFALAIDDLNEDTELGSSLVVMAIAGGALFPPLMGLISDNSNIQMSYLVPLLCFIVVAWYGLRGYKITKA